MTLLFVLLFALLFVLLFALLVASRVLSVLLLLSPVTFSLLLAPAVLLSLVRRERGATYPFEPAARATPYRWCPKLE
jgi:hypothetical protein